MNFENLKSSIELNAHEPPSLINALCMVRSLFDDVKKEAGVPLSQCPIGDGQLQQELIKVSKNLLSIYEDNSDSLQRNRARLDNVMAEILRTQSELQQLADAAAQLPGKEAEHQKLLGQLADARKAQVSYEELLRQIAAAEKELSLLEHFDFDAAQQKLTDLQGQIRALEDQVRTLDTQLQTRTEEKTKLDGDITARHRELEQLTAELERLTGEQASLLTRHQESQQKQADLQLAAEAARAEQERLDKLVAEAAQFLQCLQEQVNALAEKKNGQDTDIATLRQQIADLTSDIDTLTQERDQVLEPERRQLLVQKQALEEEKQRTRQQIADLTKETNDLNAELVQLRNDLPQRMQERNEARQRVADYRRDMLEPVTSELNDLLQTQVQLQAEKTAADKQISDLTENLQKLVLEISRRKEQYIQENNDYQNKLAREKKLIEDQETLTRNLHELTEALSLRQDEFDELNDKTLPEAEKGLASETKRRDDLQAQIDSINAECQENSKKISELEAALPAHQERLRRLRSRYDALTITFNTNNQDILEMERQIRVLEAKNDKERLDEFRTQLQSKQAELVDLAQECTRLDVQIQELDQHLQIKNADCQTLENLKRKKEEGVLGIEATLAELRPCSTPEYRRKAEALNAQYQTLLSIRNNLAASITLARRTIIGYEPASNETYILNLEEYLTKASACSLDVYQQLISCSNALKNHIMEEPK